MVLIIIQIIQWTPSVQHIIDLILDKLMDFGDGCYNGIQLYLLNSFGCTQRKAKPKSTLKAQTQIIINWQFILSDSKCSKCTHYWQICLCLLPWESTTDKGCKSCFTSVERTSSAWNDGAIFPELTSNHGTIPHHCRVHWYPVMRRLNIAPKMRITKFSHYAICIESIKAMTFVSHVLKEIGYLLLLWTYLTVFLSFIGILHGVW